MTTLTREELKKRISEQIRERAQPEDVLLVIADEDGQQRLQQRLVEEINTLWGHAPWPALLEANSVLGLLISKERALYDLVKRRKEAEVLAKLAESLMSDDPTEGVKWFGWKEGKAVQYIDPRLH